jgi:two-component system C4-dicarboxylate transport sensor histidine kinase DctB
VELSLRIKRLSFFFLVFFVLTTLIGGKAYWDYRYDSLLEEHRTQLERFTDVIDSKLDKYQHIPQLLSQDTELIDALLAPDNSAQLDITNRYLEQVNAVIQASDTYLLDGLGNTIAASNWGGANPFIGKNFAFRPYFQNAIAGQKSAYFALGSTSGLRGYYYAYPVTYAAEYIGVVVVKMDISSIERSWHSENSVFVATDTNNVIFMSSQPEWLFKGLVELTATQREKIKDSRQYLDSNIHSLGFQGNLEEPISKLTRPRINWFNQSYLSSQKNVDIPDLTLRVITPFSRLYIDLFGFIVIIGLAYTAVYLALVLIASRRYRHRQIEQIQTEAKQKLEFQVMERTAELHAEISERVKTEKALRQTQDELVQAAKLAVLGQMSASISHELNNPLAAIRSFAENGQRFIEKQKPERAKDNLARIVALTERMAKISQQLKSFAKKTDVHDLSVVKLPPVIYTAIELMQPQLKSSMIQFEFVEPELQSQVCVNPIQLEQVLINLLTNAVQALQHSDDKRIKISVVSTKDESLIHIDDSGTGISSLHQDGIFDPFYTTKDNGLGLGLSISQQIMQHFNGRIEANASPLGGARFTIALPNSDKDAV